MSTKARYRSGILTFFESATHERVAPLAPLLFYDDFLGKGLQTTDWWTAIDVSAVGLTTPLIAADVASGVARFPLDVTSEAQESGFTWGDQRPLVLNQGLIFEARVALQTLPTLLSEVVWGLAGNKNAVADTVAESIWFKADGNTRIDQGHAELAWTNLGCAIRGINHRWFGMVKDSEHGCKPQHPTQKPVAVMEWAINFTTGKTVLDPYMGSGTTGVACANLGRKFIGIELERKYFDVACERIAAAYSQLKLFNEVKDACEQESFPIG